MLEVWAVKGKEQIQEGMVKRQVRDIDKGWFDRCRKNVSVF